jgi:phosphonoacetaldehyde hydrolase
MIHAIHPHQGSLRAVVLDWAGTTVDHGSLAPARSFVDAFGALGIEMDMDEARRPMGRAKRDHIRALLAASETRRRWVEVHGEVPGEDAIDRVYEAFMPVQRQAIRERAGLIPGTVETVGACRDRGIRIGSTTGYTRDLLEVLAPVAAGQGYVPDASVTASDVSPGRPAPFLIFECARRLEVYPMTAVVKVDDTIAGIEAGLHAGCWSIGVARTGNMLGLSRAETEALPARERILRVETARRLMADAGAHFVIDGIHQLVPVLDRIESMLRDGLGPVSPRDSRQGEPAGVA